MNIGFFERKLLSVMLRFIFFSVSRIANFSFEIRTNYFMIHRMWHFELKCEQQSLVSHASGCTGNNRYIVGWTGMVGRLKIKGTEIKGENIRM